MRLYVSSIGIPNVTAFKKLFETPHPKIGIIANAWDTTLQAVRQPFIDATKQQLKQAGAVLLNVDLLKTPSLSDLDGIWILGGNTFYLNWAIHQANLPQLLKEVGENFVFGGESAGAVVAGQTLHGIEFLDDPKEAPTVIWEGLKLLPEGVIPHWGTTEDAQALTNCKKEMAKYAPVKTLTDEQFIVI